jgi:signal transduction histidine kinase
MESTVIISAVAVGVSILSVAANVYIASRSRKTSLEVLTVKADLDRTDAAYKSIKQVEVEGERLRIRCWNLVHRFELWVGSEQESRGLDDAVQALEQQEHSFIESWADSKTDFPYIVAWQLQRMRHEIRNSINRVYTLAAICRSDKTRRRLSELEKGVEQLLGELDRFIITISLIRKSLTRGSFERLLPNLDDERDRV